MRILKKCNNSDIIALSYFIELPTISMETFNNGEGDVTEGHFLAALKSIPSLGCLIQEEV